MTQHPAPPAPRPRRASRVRPALVQVLVMALFAAVGAVPLVGATVVSLFAGWPAVIGVLAVVVLGVHALGAVTSRGSPLTGHPLTRAVWAVLLVGGTAGTCAAVYGVLRDLGHDPAAVPVLGSLAVGLVAAAVAAVLTLRPAVALPALALVTATAFVLHGAEVRDRPADDLADRLAAQRTTPELVVETDVPGYGPGTPSQANSDGPFTLTYTPATAPTPADGVTPAPESWISVWATEHAPFECEDPVDPATLDPGVDVTLLVRCVEESPGLWFLSWWDGHEYVRAQDGTWIHARAPLTTDRAVLRAAAVDARRVPADRLLDVLPPVDGTS